MRLGERTSDAATRRQRQLVMLEGAIAALAGVIDSESETSKESSSDHGLLEQQRYLEQVARLNTKNTDLRALVRDLSFHDATNKKV